MGQHTRRTRRPTRPGVPNFLLIWDICAQYGTAYPTHTWTHSSRSPKTFPPSLRANKTGGLCVCVCVCVCVCLCVCIYIYIIPTHAHARAHAHIHTHKHPHPHTHTHTHTHAPTLKEDFSIWCNSLSQEVADICAGGEVRVLDHVLYDKVCMYAEQCVANVLLMCC